MSLRLPLVVSVIIAFATACGGSADMTASPAPSKAVPVVTTVVVAPATSQVELGATTVLTADIRDQFGALMTAKSAAWTTSDAAVLTIGAATGVATGVAVGQATVTASVDGKTASASITVVPVKVVATFPLSGMTPAVLTPGATATISGSNFVAAPSGNTVTIAGVPATVTAATTTSLTITVPSAGLPCLSTQPVAVTVQNSAGIGTLRQPLLVATSRTLAVGEHFLATAGGNIGCNEISGGGTYLVSVVNAATNAGQAAGFELTGSSGGVLAQEGALASTGLAAPTAAAHSISIAAPAPTAHSALSAGVNATEQQHLAHLDADLALIRQLGSPKNYRRPTRSSSVSGLSPNGAASYSLSGVPATVGANATINFHFNSCALTASTPVTARVVYVGPKTIVLEDNASPLAGKIDADMVSLAQEFETVSYPELVKFGNPLAYDAQTDANGRLIMLFTPQVNSAGTNLLGFVSSCDFFPPTAAPSVGASNLGEIFYARAVTDTSATSTSFNGRPQWRRQMPSTLIHEAKHILSFSERFATPVSAAYEEVWMEEATAQIASELYGRAIHGNGFRSDATYKGTLDCEVRPSVGACNGGIFVMGNHFGFLSDYLQNFESKSILSGSDDNDIYGSSWLFARWLVDTYGGTDEAAFLRKLINFTDVGVRNATSATGKSWAELLTQFQLMLAADNLPGAAAPFTLQSWNLPGIFAGYNTDFPSSRPAAPLAMRSGSYGPFATTVSSLKGGGGMLLKLSGFSGSQMLGLRGLSGAPLSSNIAISVLRVQ